MRVAEFAADATKPESMRILAIQALRDWGPGRSAKRDIVEGRIVARRHSSVYCIEGIDESIEELFSNAQGELLMETLRFANEQHLNIPEDVCSTLILDESMPVQIRAYALQISIGEELIEFALQSEHWQLRAVARDVLLERADATADDLLLNTVETGEIFEAQEAIKSLASKSSALSKIDKETLRAELQLDYAEVVSPADGISNEWLVVGGNAMHGKKVVFENSKSECLRCHKINGSGGIAGPSLDGVASRLEGGQLLDALLLPSAEVTEGFGTYSAMPPMGSLLSQREIRDVVAYLKTLTQSD
jgi:mono/diheme cytochrome c family protein